MDIDVSIITTATIISSKDLLKKILGPTADYIGGEIKNLVENLLYQTHLNTQLIY